MKLIKGLNLLRPCSETPFLENAFVVIDGDEFLSVGTTEPEGEFEEVLDCGGKFALPGLINAHHHLYSALAVGMPPPPKTPLNFTQILEEVWWKLDLALDHDATQASFEAGLIDSLKAGTTTVIDHHCSPSFIEGSLSLLGDTGKKLGIATGLAFEVTDRNGQELFERSLHENLDAAEKHSQDQELAALLGLHASFTLSEESLKKVAEVHSKRSNWGIHTHLSEDRADEEDARNRGHVSVVERLDHFGLINQSAMLIHGVHSLESDAELIQKHKAHLVHNPTSNANNRIGMLSNQAAERMKPGLGTDGMQSNMIREAKEGMLIRSSHMSAGDEGVDYQAILFDHNPRIASAVFGRSIGRVEPGYRADLAIYDYHPRTEVHSDNVFGHVFFGLGEPCDVMSGGKMRVQNHLLQGNDEEAAKQEAAEQSRKLWQRMQ